MKNLFISIIVSGACLTFSGCTDYLDVSDELASNLTIEQTFNTNIKFEKAIIEKKPMQYLYGSGDMYNFMNMETYEQIDLAKESLGDNAKFLKEGLEVEVTFYKGEVLGINLPEKIEYEVIETEPAVKGDTATGATKNATIETGYQIKVPLFINEGEMVLVNTVDGKYQGRA